MVIFHSYVSLPEGTIHIWGFKFTRGYHPAASRWSPGPVTAGFFPNHLATKKTGSHQKVSMFFNPHQQYRFNIGSIKHV